MFEVYIAHISVNSMSQQLHGKSKTQELLNTTFRGDLYASTELKW